MNSTPDIPGRENVIALNVPVIPDGSVPDFLRAGTVRRTLSDTLNHDLPSSEERRRTIPLSHLQILQAAVEATQERYPDDGIAVTDFRCSHPVSNIDGNPLLHSLSKSFFYARSSFTIEIPSVSFELGGQSLSLTLGGLVAYPNPNDLDWRLNRGYLKLFAGFRVHICTNLCAGTDGVALEVKAQNAKDLKDRINELIDSFDVEEARQKIKAMQDRRIPVSGLIRRLLGGQSRQWNSRSERRLFEILTGDASPHELRTEGARLLGSEAELPFGSHEILQILTRMRTQAPFREDADGQISIWNFYNQLTEALKDVPQERFLEGHVQAFQFARQLLAEAPTFKATQRPRPYRFETAGAQTPNKAKKQEAMEY